VATGALVQAAAAQNAMPVTLELGGKSPQIVFADADLDAALPFLVNAGIQNAGRPARRRRASSSSGRSTSTVRARMAERYRALRVGPALADLDVGPVISRASATSSSHYLALARDAGLQIAAQAEIARDAPRGGTTCADAGRRRADEHALAQEEIFGPVQVLIPFDGEAEALRIANGTPYGLVAGVWTRDGGRAAAHGAALKCGQVFVNNYGAGGGVELPFGGVKRSGHGREKGFEALYGFSTLKTVAIHHG
jgi:aldehyde dehydrogenase (NAD+)